MTEARLFSRHSIGTRIAALFMLLILVVTAAMTYVSISVSTNELLDSSTEYTEQLIRRVNAELDMYVEYMKDISDFIVDNGAVAAYLRAANEHRLTDAAYLAASPEAASVAPAYAQAVRTLARIRGGREAIDQVRALLAEKSGEGKTKEVKALLNKYDAGKLSGVKP